MAFIEGILCEIGHFIKYCFGSLFGYSVGKTAGNLSFNTINKVMSFLCHDLSFFLAHGTPYKVASSEAVSGKVTNNLHNLLLINNTAVSILKNRLKCRRRILNITGIIFAPNIFGYEIHRTRTIERNSGYKVLKTARFKLLHELLHATAFKLENTFRLSGGNHCIDIFVSVGKVINIHIYSMYTLYFIYGVFNNGQCS